MKYLKLFLIVFLAMSVIINAQGKQKKPTAKAAQKEETTPMPPPPDGVFIHLSSGTENPQKVLMALSMALKMSSDKEVYVYLDVNAVQVVLSSSKSIELPKFEPSKIIVDKLIAKGIKVAVCPTCLEAVNKSQFDLMKGVAIADKDDFFNFTRGRILSLSY